MPESVWDYPRPPRVQACDALVEVRLGGSVIVCSRASVRVLETSHPPVFYLPADAIRDGVLRRTRRTSFCEFKGRAHYFDLVVGERTHRAAAWGYDDPSPGFEWLRDRVALYPGRMDSCTVDGEIVQAQPGDFYGGWITSAVTGPFKGAPGTLGW